MQRMGVDALAVGLCHAVIPALLGLMDSRERVEAGFEKRHLG